MAQKTFLVARRSDQAISGLHTTHGCRDTVAELLADSLEALSRVRGASA